MEVNVLKEISASKILLIYNDASGKKRKEVSLGYYDENSCFFSLNINLNFLLPDINSKAEIVFYTPNGIYRATAKFIDIEKTAGKVLFETTVPKKWKFIQRRKYMRKSIPLPVTIKYDDGFTISTKINNISAGGFAIYKKGAFSGIYQKLTANILIEFPEGAILHLENNVVNTKANCIRVEEDLPGHFGEKLIAYEFVGLNEDITTGIRRFISMYED